ncbi:MAG: hypothetical protein AAF518_21755 [Spirochaetota bacterium]
MEFLELTSTAYHESGHAVMAFLQKVRIVKISIVPDERMGISGMLVKSNKILDSGDRETFLDRIESFILIAMSGMVAESILNAYNNYQGAEKDIEYIKELLQHLTYNQKEQDLYENLLWARTKNILQKSQNWDMIKKLALYLLHERKTLSGKEVMQFLRNINSDIDRKNISNIKDSLEKI